MSVSVLAGEVLAGFSLTDPKHPVNGGEVVLCGDENATGRLDKGCRHREYNRLIRKAERDLATYRAFWERSKAWRAAVIPVNQIKQLVKDAHTGEAQEVEFDFRLACYCRRHGLKSYKVVFTFYDTKRRFLGRSESPDIEAKDGRNNNST
ncbi:hypothetical protein M011DRAFT_479895 [Sporormia fimetaria CBS 119925]|uniref:SPT23/MGA2-like DNA-binding domain-containing protein n=1 Tax=Sporormia fimetaria CBS 119925 TaxID=1340428 RepID=A0A6A6V230_9PLEO|nr:hypothetical protein M011DRAFT_479895 [Sporormia fimetaria CBS 119925]